jgi:hypothetical protein
MLRRTRGSVAGFWKFPANRIGELPSTVWEARIQLPDVEFRAWRTAMC